MKLEAPKIIVAIYIRGDRLEPDLVSQVLGIQPSQSQRKGGLCAGSAKFVAKIGLWALMAQNVSTGISGGVDELLKKVGNPPIPLDKIDGVEEAYLDVFIALDDENGTKETVEFTLTRNHMKELTRIGLFSRFTVT